MLIRWTAVRSSARLVIMEGEPSYSYYYSGFYFAPQSEALVRWTVRLFVSFGRLRSLVPSYSYLIGGTVLRWVLATPQSGALGRWTDLHSDGL